MDLVSLFNLDETEEDKAGTPNRQVELWAQLVHSAVTLSLTIILFVRKNKLRFPKKMLECIEPFKYTLDFLEKVAPDPVANGEPADPQEKPEFDLSEIPEPPLNMKKIKIMAKAMSQNTPMCKCLRGKQNCFHTEKVVEDVLPLMDWTNPPPKDGAMTFLNVNIPEGKGFTYTLNRFYEPGCVYQFSKIEDGYFRVFSVADGVNGPPEGPYTIRTETESLGVCQLIVFNHAYMLIDVETNEQIDIEEGEYILELEEDEDKRTHGCLVTDVPLVNLHCTCHGETDYLYFVSRSSVAGMFRVMYCDVEHGQQPFPDGMYSLWDVCSDGHTNPSTISEGVYYLMRCAEQLDQVLQNAPAATKRGKLLCERFIKIESETDPLGLNVTRIIRHTQQFAGRSKHVKTGSTKSIPILEFRDPARAPCCKCPVLDISDSSTESGFGEDEEEMEEVDVEAVEEAAEQQGEPEPEPEVAEIAEAAPAGEEGEKPAADASAMTPGPVPRYVKPTPTVCPLFDTDEPVRASPTPSEVSNTRYIDIEIILDSDDECDDEDDSKCDPKCEVKKKKKHRRSHRRSK